MPKGLGYGLVAAGNLLPPLIGLVDQKLDQRKADKHLNPLIEQFNQGVGPIEGSKIMEQQIEPALSRGAKQAMVENRQDPAKMEQALQYLMLKSIAKAKEVGIDEETLLKKMKPYQEMFQLIGKRAKGRFDTMKDQPGMFVRPSGQAGEGEQVMASHSGLDVLQPAPFQDFAEDYNVPEQPATTIPEMMKHHQREMLAEPELPSSPQEEARQVDWKAMSSGKYDMGSTEAEQARLARLQQYPQLGGPNETAQAALMENMQAGETFGSAKDAMAALRANKDEADQLGMELSISTNPNDRYVLNATPVKPGSEKLSPQSALNRKLMEEDLKVATTSLAERFTRYGGELGDMTSFERQEWDKLKQQYAPIIQDAIGGLFDDPSQQASRWKNLWQRFGGPPEGLENTFRDRDETEAIAGGMIQKDQAQRGGAPTASPQTSPMQNAQALFRQAVTVVPELDRVARQAAQNPTPEMQAAMTQIMQYLRSVAAYGPPPPERLKQDIERILAQHGTTAPQPEAGMSVMDLLAAPSRGFNRALDVGTEVAQDPGATYRQLFTQPEQGDRTSAFEERLRQIRERQQQAP